MLYILRGHESRCSATAVLQHQIHQNRWDIPTGSIRTESLQISTNGNSKYFFQSVSLDVFYIWIKLENKGFIFGQQAVSIYERTRFKHYAELFFSVIPEGDETKEEQRYGLSSCRFDFSIWWVIRRRCLRCMSATIDTSYILCKWTCL